MEKSKKKKKAANRLNLFIKKKPAPAAPPKGKKAPTPAKPAKMKKTGAHAPRPEQKQALFAYGTVGLAALGALAYSFLSGRRQEPVTGEEPPAEGTPSKKAARPSVKRVLLLIMGVCCLAVFCFSAYKIVSELWQSHKEAEAFEELTNLFGPDYTPVYPDSTEPAATGPAATDPAATGPMVDDPLSTIPVATAPAPPPHVVYRFSKYDDVYALNNDMFGWIAIDGTQINYPVMHTPNDPEYYLRRGFDKKKANAGTPFLSGNCYIGCGNYIVYGHRMNNGTMFRDLLNYEKKSYWQAHPIIHFDLVEEPGDYEIIAAFYTRVYAVNEVNVFRYYNYTDLTNEATFNEYMTQVYASARYDTGVTAEYGDQLLTLSTCSYHVENGRFVVVAKRIEK